jgi:hypothetical protein
MRAGAGRRLPNTARASINLYRDVICSSMTVCDTTALDGEVPIVTRQSTSEEHVYCLLFLCIWTWTREIFTCGLSSILAAQRHMLMAVSATPVVSAASQRSDFYSEWKEKMSSKRLVCRYMGQPSKMSG